jgi:hypothetical protein
MGMATQPVMVMEAYEGWEELEAVERTTKRDETDVTNERR